MIDIEKTWSFLRQKFSVVDNRIPYKVKKQIKLRKSTFCVLLLNEKLAEQRIVSHIKTTE